MERNKEEKVWCMCDLKICFYLVMYKFNYVEIEFDIVRLEIEGWKEKEEVLWIEKDYFFNL